MSNPEIAKYYLGLPIAQGKISSPTPATIYSELDKFSNGNWAWEVSSEFLAMDNSMISTTIMLYIPGRILTGRSFCPVKDIGTAHIAAIIDAAKLITDQGQQQQAQPTPPPQQNQYQNMTVDQIQNVLNANNQQQPQPPQQQPNPDADLPFYFGPTDPNAPPEVKAEHAAQQAAQAAQTAPNPQGEIGYDEPNPARFGFSQRQLDRVADMKKRACVIDDTSFCNYIHMWNNNFFKKSHLTPQNVDAFVDWYDALEKSRTGGEQPPLG